MALGHENNLSEAVATVLDRGREKYPEHGYSRRTEQVDCRHLDLESSPVRGLSAQKGCGRSKSTTRMGSSGSREPITRDGQCGDAEATEPGPDGDSLKKERVACPVESTQ